MSTRVSDRHKSLKFIDEKMGHRTVLSEASSRKLQTPKPVADIMERFHKLKEDKFKRNRENVFVKSNLNVLKGDIDDVGTGSNTSGQASRVEGGTKSRSVQKERIQTLKRTGATPKQMKDDNSEDGTTGRSRRMSLPSLFHPLVPLSTTSESTESTDTSNEAPNPQSRVHLSVPHVMAEYSKRNLNHLTKEHELKLKEMNDAEEIKEHKNLLEMLSKTRSDEEFPKWLTGDDLHAYYHVWQKPEPLDWMKRNHTRKTLSPSDELATSDEDKEQ